jgi:hypothetical protein
MIVIELSTLLIPLSKRNPAKDTPYLGLGLHIGYAMFITHSYMTVSLFQSHTCAGSHKTSSMIAFRVRVFTSAV